MSLKHFFRMPALSPTQQHTLLHLAQQHVSAHIQNIETEYCFNAHNGQSAFRRPAKTDSPICYPKPLRQIGLQSSHSCRDLARSSKWDRALNFSTAWSTNATAICHACGITQISAHRTVAALPHQTRPEPGTAKYLFVPRSRPHDRMPSIPTRSPLLTPMQNQNPYLRFPS